MHTRTFANELWREFNRRAGIRGQALHDVLQLGLGADFEREMVQANIAPTIEANDRPGVIDLPER
jgi:hypothetical protein